MAEKNNSFEKSGHESEKFGFTINVKELPTNGVENLEIAGNSRSVNISGVEGKQTIKVCAKVKVFGCDSRKSAANFCKTQPPVVLQGRKNNSVTLNLKRFPYTRAITKNSIVSNQEMGDVNFGDGIKLKNAIIGGTGNIMVNNDVVKMGPDSKFVAQSGGPAPRIQILETSIEVPSGIKLKFTHGGEIKVRGIHEIIVTQAVNKLTANNVNTIHIDSKLRKGLSVTGAETVVTKKPIKGTINLNQVASFRMCGV